MIKRLFFLFVFAISFVNIYADEPEGGICPTRGSGHVRRSPKAGQKTLSIEFEDGILRITSLRVIGDFSIVIKDEQTDEEKVYSTYFSEIGTEWVLELPTGEYIIEINGEDFYWQSQL